MGRAIGGVRGESPGIEQGLHVVVKPVGARCNLDCEYCYYLEKRVLFGAGEDSRMPDDVLSALIRNYVASQPTPVVEFVWQGGEPTLAGLDFFRKAVREQKRCAGEKSIRNSLQTNGTLLTESWCEWLKENDFMVGISLDGPPGIHDAGRRDRQGRGTFPDVVRGLRRLRKHGVEYNVLACVTRDAATKPREVYSSLKDEGVEFIQFSPVVERRPDEDGRRRGFRLAGPSRLDRTEEWQVTPWTVRPGDFGDFLIAIYEDWIRHDVGKVFVMNFEWALNAWIGNPSPVCVHAEQCGRAVVVEHDGDVYACDHFVYPPYRLGNIARDSLKGMVDESLDRGFGSMKGRSLPGWCRDCPVLAACWGGCPKHRFLATPSGEPGLNYLCEGYRKFFLHIRRYLDLLTRFLESDVPVANVMEALKGPTVPSSEPKDRSSRGRGDQGRW